LSEEKYQVENGTYYDAHTPRAVVLILEGVRTHETRIRLYYGDRETGRDWNECYDVTGRVGRSTGPIKIPLLIHNRRSMGGAGILDRCIIKITTAKGGKVLYQQPNYFNPESVEFELHQLEEVEAVIYRANREVI
jgi:hypothetical protein